jgi:hypothetical protein
VGNRDLNRGKAAEEGWRSSSCDLARALTRISAGGVRPEAYLRRQGSSPVVVEGSSADRRGRAVAEILREEGMDVILADRGTLLRKDQVARSDVPWVAGGGERRVND